MTASLTFSLSNVNYFPGPTAQQRSLNVLNRNDNRMQIVVETQLSGTQAEFGLVAVNIDVRRGRHPVERVELEVSSLVILHLYPGNKQTGDLTQASSEDVRQGNRVNQGLWDDG